MGKTCCEMNKEDRQEQGELWEIKREVAEDKASGLRELELKLQLRLELES